MTAIRRSTPRRRHGIQQDELTDLTYLDVALLMLVMLPLDSLLYSSSWKCPM